MEKRMANFMTMTEDMGDKKQEKVWKEYEYHFELTER